MKYFKRLSRKLARLFIKEDSFTDITTAQRKLAFDDSQKFIYDNSSLNTLTFSGPNAVKELRTYCIKNLNKEGDLFEFGVFKGKTLNLFAKTLKEIKDERIIVGFDSWKGFSEEWAGLNDNYAVHKFDQKGSLPQVEPNTVLVNGYIEETLPKFVKDNVGFKSVAFIHIDTDTYSPAKVALTELKQYFKSGTIILFDELLGYPNWRNHEFKALEEVLHRSEYEFLGFAHTGRRAILIKAAIRIV